MAKYFLIKDRAVCKWEGIRVQNRRFSRMLTFKTFNSISAYLRSSSVGFSIRQKRSVTFKKFSKKLRPHPTGELTTLPDAPQPVSESCSINTHLTVPCVQSVNAS